MQPTQYQKEVKRTLSAKFEVKSEEKTKVDLLHAAIGASTEANELLDAMKKVIFYGKPLDVVNIKEEIGDILYYVAVACNALGTSLTEEMERNINKLKFRYPEKFTEEAALNRDLEGERKTLNISMNNCC